MIAAAPNRAQGRVAGHGHGRRTGGRKPGNAGRPSGDVIYAPAYSTSDDLASLARESAVDAILVRQGQISHAVIEASPRLRVVAKHGSGVDNIDLSAATARGVPVLRALAANAQSSPS